MGNGIGKLGGCFAGIDDGKRRPDISVLISNPLDEGLGHSFCYVRPDPSRLSSSKVHSDETTTFRSISGAAVSANTSTPLSTSLLDLYSYSSIDRAPAFESSNSFASIPLQPIPRNMINSGPISGHLERGFLSGPIERGFMSGPLDKGIFSGPLDNSSSTEFQRSFSHGGGFNSRSRSRKNRLIRILRSAIPKSIYRGKNSIVAPIKAVKEPDWIVISEKHNENLTVSSLNFSSEGSLEDDESMQSQNLQWAQGKAGEDRVHVVVSEEHGWVFVGIYDGFNGPDAPDYLLSNLYSSVHKELKGLLWDENLALAGVPAPVTSPVNRTGDACSRCVEQENHPSRRRKGKNSRGKFRGAAEKWEDNQRRWKCEWDQERLELDRRLKEQLNRSESNGSRSINHSDVLKALSQALKNTEEAYLDIADKVLDENPELALMGSCVLVMLMKGDDVYVMNVGDSRAVLAQKADPDYWLGMIRQDLERISEEPVTRAFGAGFLKQPKWNNALLEMFRIDYVGRLPYISCQPCLYHHRLGPKDRFLILSSDGLYQYFTNEEAVSEVELFITLQPEGDPAQHLIELLLFRAAKRAGMDFHELLEIPQGDRRKYHDDVSIIVISLEGRIWRSCV
ncbi:putative protein phosphatase 2C 4, partial [Cucurbita argyrosperma subsp. argyrosperma]